MKKKVFRERYSEVTEKIEGLYMPNKISTDKYFEVEIEKDGSWTETLVEEKPKKRGRKKSVKSNK